MTFMTSPEATRLIRHGHSCLGVAGPAGLTLTAGGHNDSLLWSRNPASGSGQLHTWSPWGNGKAEDDLPGFNGERCDPVIGSYHLGNGYRAYNPVLRRFNCPDSLSPFGAGGINPYAYCAGDPVNHTDPTGHISWQGFVGIVAGAIGVLLTGGAALGAIATAGSVAAAWSAASTTTLVVGSMGLLADATGIASGATEDSNPQASSVLGWVSMATGIAGMAAGFGIAGSATSKRVINLKSLVTKTQKNRLSTLFDDIGQWKDISMPEEFSVQNRIKSSEAYEVLLSTNAKKSYEIRNLKTKELSVPHGVYNFVNPSSAPGRIYAMEYHEINHKKYIGHTSLTRSKGIAAPVRYAGMMKFDNGRLIYWNNLSGHYRPPIDLSYSNLIPWARRILPENKFKTNFI